MVTGRYLRDQDRDNCELKLIDLCGHLDIKAIIVQLEFIKNDYLVVAINELGRRKGIPVIAMEKHLSGRVSVSMRSLTGPMKPCMRTKKQERQPDNKPATF